MTLTYLEIINEVLARLREDEVTSPTETTYSSLIGRFVNQAKREVEDTWEWIGLRNTIQATTVSGDYRYSLDGIKERFKIINIFNDTTNREIMIRPSTWMSTQFNTAPISGEPQYYDVSGVDETTGDYQIDLYPIPNAVWTININLFKRQAKLVTDSTETAVPSYPIMLRALYSALVERGEDGGLMAAESYRDYKQSLSDAIAFDAQRSMRGMHDWHSDYKPTPTVSGY
jgi:hypothetical protein